MVSQLVNVAGMNIVLQVADLDQNLAFNGWASHNKHKI